jgi:hypothetical protein
MSGIIMEKYVLSTTISVSICLVIFMPLTSVTRNMSVYYFLHESYVFVINHPQYETDSGIDSRIA